MPYPHKFIKLTKKERQLVLAESKRLSIKGDWKRRRRLHILHHSDQGMSFHDIAGLLDISYMTVRRWIYHYIEKKASTRLSELLKSEHLQPP